jgi:hypothetical protein
MKMLCFRRAVDVLSRLEGVHPDVGSRQRDGHIYMYNSRKFSEVMYLIVC